MSADTMKSMFGLLLLVVIAVFGGMIISGRVSEQSSYGLHEIIGILAVVAGAFMQSWLGSRNGGQK